MDYKFSFGYDALKMLGKNLYSNPFSAISELVANGFDADAKNVYIYLDIQDKKESTVEIIDDGNGMSDIDVQQKYLQVGNNNRTEKANIMGRKGIGKLAAFYLSNEYYISTKTFKESNDYSINFSDCENIDKKSKYMDKYDGSFIVNKALYSALKTGTAITIKNVDLSGLGDKRLENFYSEISEYFAFGDDSRIIHIKIIEKAEDLKNDFIEVKKKIAFKNMECILYSGEEGQFEPIKKLNGVEIKNAEKEDDETVFVIKVDKIDNKCRTAFVSGKEVKMNPYGWIGIHQTINRKKAHKNDSNFLENKFYNFNKIRIYVRNKLAMDNLLPEIHNTQYYANYIEGEIHCDELDLNDFPDIASSNRQSFDINDDRVQSLINYVTSIVNELVNKKTNESDKDKEKKKKKQLNAVNTLSEQVGKSLEDIGRGKITKEEISIVQQEIVNAFENIGGVAKTKYTLFISHKRDDKLISDFIYFYLINVCKYPSDFIFYTSSYGGADERVSTLGKQIVDILSKRKTYVCFFVGKGFQNSQYCMFEGGAAWAVKQRRTIGLFYDDYKLVPDYLKPMKNIKTFLNSGKLDENNYVQTVNFINDIIAFLNNNYLEDDKKVALLNNYMPDKVQLARDGKKYEDYFDKNVVDYWNKYISDNYLEYCEIYNKKKEGTIDHNKKKKKKNTGRKKRK